MITGLVITACGSIAPQEPASSHLLADTQQRIGRDIPPPVAVTAILPRPKAAEKTETYSVSIRNIPVQELLFALARDARLNVDIHPGINGSVTINAIDQTLQQLLTRIAKQVDMRWELDGPNLAVMPDSPFLRSYRIDYVNMSREMQVSTSVSSQVTSISGTGGAASSGGSAMTKIDSSAKNRFWETLEQNIKDVLRETDKIMPEGSSETVIERTDRQATTGTGATGPQSSAGKSGTQGLAASPTPASVQQSGNTVIKRTTFREAASVIANPETGLITVRATGRQHEKIQEFVDLIMSAARRQVLIEATIAEVTLSQNYQQGIDWQRMRGDGTGFSLTQSAPGILTSAAGVPTPTTAVGGAALAGITQVPGGTITSGATNSLFVLSYRNSGQALINFASAVKLLESFGNVKVLSSPKLSVLNNQTALLKVVNNVVYFSVKADTTVSTSGTQINVTTTPQSVSVGLVMSVTPQISDTDSVVLNVRPMISRVTSFKSDPNPSIPAGLSNLVPEIETREMESVLRVGNGDIAILGGLMQDSTNYKDDAVPGLSRLPGIGNLFSYKNETATKTELVIFLRPVVVREAMFEGDERTLGATLPDKNFLQRSWGMQITGKAQ